MKAIIIGAGLGGLTFGALLARDGYEVTVYDKNDAPGGVTALAKQNGFMWEQGPLILGDLLPGEPVYELLQTFGITLPTVRADRGIEMPDYTMWKPERYAGPYWRRDALKARFPESAKGIDAYYRLYDALMRLRYLAGLHGGRPTLWTKLRMALTFLLHVRPYADMTAAELTERLFHNEKVAALFTGILADFCADPAEVQGIGLPFCNMETAFDLRIPLEENGRKTRSGYCCIEGGCQKLPEALAAYITAHGGRVTLGTVVEKVLVRDGRACGVRLSDGTEDAAEWIVGSGGGREFFYELVGKEHLDAAYLKILETYRPMEAVFMLHLGVDYDPMQYQKAPLCYYYGTYDLHAATERLRSGVYHEGEDGYLIFVPSAHAPEFAPAGKHCVTIYTVAPDTLRDGTWEENKRRYADRLIALASRQLPDLSAHIVEEKIMTAVEYRQLTHMHKCAFGGVVPVWKQQNPPYVTPVKGLYFVGQQSESGGGVGAVMLGAREAYQRMQSAEGKRQNGHE